jgi:hypothetical protein
LSRLAGEPSNSVIQPVPGGPEVAQAKAVNATASNAVTLLYQRFIVILP